MVDVKTTTTYRKDARFSGKLLSKEEREELVRPYLPKSVKAQPGSATRRKPIRQFLKTQVYLFIFNLLHFFFSVYIHLRRYYHAVTGRVSAVLYYHHRTPELIRKDVRGLSKLPKHLSVVLELAAPRRKRQDTDGLEKLLDEVAEISAWCACAGISTLSVYERSGILKRYVPATHRAVADKLHAYFGPKRPSLQVRAPHMQTFLNGDVSEEEGGSGAAGADLGMWPIQLPCSP